MWAIWTHWKHVRSRNVCERTSFLYILRIMAPSPSSGLSLAQDYYLFHKAHIKEVFADPRFSNLGMEEMFFYRGNDKCAKERKHFGASLVLTHFSFLFFLFCSWLSFVLIVSFLSFLLFVLFVSDLPMNERRNLRKWSLQITDNKWCY